MQRDEKQEGWWERWWGKRRAMVESEATLLLQRREHFLLNEAIELLLDELQRSLVRVPERRFLLDLPAVDAEVVVLEQLLVDVGRDRRVEDRVLVAELRERRHVLVVGVLGHAGQVQPREVRHQRAQEAGLDLEQRGQPCVQLALREIALVAQVVDRTGGALRCGNPAVRNSAQQRKEKSGA